MNLRSSRVLAIGAHPDDLEFGCFGALSYSLTPHLLIMSKGSLGGDGNIRSEEAKKSAALICGNLIQLDYPDTRLSIPEMVSDIEDAVGWSKPAIVFTMADDDTHQDHSAVAKASMIALRHFEGQVFAYGTPSSFDKFSPQVILELDKGAMELKLDALRLHVSQGGKQYMESEFVRSIARYWASMSRIGIEYGEAFELVKWYSHREKLVSDSA